MRPAWKSLSVLALLCALGACAKDDPFRPGARSITGHVKLTGYLVHDDATFAGTLVAGDVDGLPVELIYGEQVLARTTTSHGVYRFTGVQPGGYIARCRIVPGIEDETNPLVVADRDVEVVDTLRIRALGDLVPVPNPVVDTTRVYFQVNEAARIQIELRDIGGTVVHRLMDRTLLPELYNVFVRLPRPTSRFYWVTFDAGTDVRAQLLMLGGTSALAATPREMEARGRR